MSQETFNFWSIILQIIIALGASIFALWQTLINRRLKKLQDYVAVSVLSLGRGNNSIMVMNVGKINLYLKQYVIGANTETFSKPLLIPAGTGENSNLRIALQNLQPIMPMKFYLLDELGEKYISTGQVIVEQLTLSSLPKNVPAESGTATPQPAQSVIVPEFKIWTFKTEKYGWMI